MIEHRAVKPTLFAGTILAFALATTPAFAVNKDMVQLQTQIQDLQQAVTHLQQSNDERMGVMKDLVQQTADSVNKMSVAMDTLQQQMRAQQEASSGKLDQVSSQVQALNDSLDEVKARMNSLEKILKGVQGQQQSINAALQNMNPTPGGAQGDGSNPGASNQPLLPPNAPTNDAANTPSDNPFPTRQGSSRNGRNAPPVAPANPDAAPVADLYKTALSDFMAAKYPLATQEFVDVIRNYPDDPLSGNAYYYLGQIDYTGGKFAAAIKNYDHVIDQFPANPKVPVSHLHKGMALLSLKNREAGIAEMRTLIQRFPNSPEAAQARTKLNGMGVPATVRHP